MKASKPECSFCGEKARFRCAYCKLTSYCSKECSVAHFDASHRDLCKRWREADEDMLAAKTIENVSSQLPPDVSAAVFVNGRFCSRTMERAQCDLITVCAEINTPASLRAAMVEAQKLIKSRTNKTQTEELFVLPWLFLLDPHPDNVRLCYTVMRFDLLATYELGDVLEPPRASTEEGLEQGESRIRFLGTRYHTLPHLIVKCLVAAEAGAFLDRVDVLLMSRSSVWRDPVVIANLADFLWPRQHFLARVALAARSGQKGLGTIGHLRAAQAELFVGIRAVSEEAQTLLKLLLSEQAPTECEGQPVSTTPFSAPAGSVGELYTLARMYHPVLHNPRVPLMAQVRGMLEDLVKQG